MKRSGLKRGLILGLCVCMGVFPVGCSSQNSKKEILSQDEEYQAEEEISDIVSDNSSDTVLGDSDSDVRQNEEKKDSESSTEYLTEAEITSQDVTVYNYASMEKVLAAMVSVMEDEKISRYYRERLDGNLATYYLHAYVNMFDRDMFMLLSQLI